MEVEVRSDFELALKVRDANGRTRTVGHYAAHVEEGFHGKVPHLQRVHPSGRFLASYDAQHARIVIDPLDGSGASFEVPVEDAPAEIHQFRWLDHGRGMMISTPSQVYVLPLDPGAPPATTRPTEVLPPSDVPVEIQDTRIMDGGMLVRLHELHQVQMPPTPIMVDTGIDLVFGDRRLAEREVMLGDPDYMDYHDAQFMDGLINRRGQAVYVSLDGVDVTGTRGLADPQQTVTAAMILSGGRVAAMVGPFETGPWAESEAASMWVTTPSPEGWSVSERRGCADRCEVSTWAPGAHVPIHASGPDVVVGGDPGRTLEVPGGEINVLWADLAHDRLLAGNSDTLVLWEGQQERWRHSLEDTELLSANFDPTGRWVYAATDGTILRLSTTTGRAQRVVKIRSYVRNHYEEGTEDEWGGYTETMTLRRLDGVVPLPGGGLAYAVLEAEEQTEAY